MSGRLGKGAWARLGPGAARATRAILAMLAVAFVAACDDDEGPTPDEIAIELRPGTITVPLGGTVSTVAKIQTDLTDPMHMTAIDVPEGLTVSFTPEDLGAGMYDAQVKVTAAAGMVPGAYHLHVQAACDHASSQSLMLSVTVVDPAAGMYTLGVVPHELNLKRGATVTATVQIGRIAPFDGEVEFAAHGLPDGVLATFRPARTTLSAVTLDLATDSVMAEGDYEIEIVGMVEGMNDVVLPVTLTVPPPTFALDPEPDSLLLAVGGAAAEVEVAILREAGFTDEVEVVITGVPAGLLLSQVPPTTITGDEFTLVLQAGEGMAPGRYSFTVAGWTLDRSRSASIKFVVTVEAPS